MAGLGGAKTRCGTSLISHPFLQRFPRHEVGWDLTPDGEKPYGLPNQSELSGTGESRIQKIYSRAVALLMAPVVQRCGLRIVVPGQPLCLREVPRGL